MGYKSDFQDINKAVSRAVTLLKNVLRLFQYAIILIREINEDLPYERIKRVNENFRS